MQLYDISITLRPTMAVWPGDDPFRVTPTACMANGDNCNLSRLEMGSHTGTHVDPPLHFIDGADGVDKLDLERLVGPAEVLDCTGMREVDAHALEGRLAEGVIPLLKTDSSHAPDTAPFCDDYVYLTLEAARLVAKSGVKTVGIDYLSIAGKDATPVHQALLGAGIVIIEGLRLAHVPPGRYTLVCLPLKIEGCDGAPARAILIET
ncbi:MAG: cyclase family protein [Planctomycetes bacterium]|nr:cyclase family protein [Planctomycetota bacterium]